MQYAKAELNSKHKCLFPARGQSLKKSTHKIYTSLRWLFHICIQFGKIQKEESQTSKNEKSDRKKLGILWVNE